VDQATNKADDLPAAQPTRRDSGATFVELLVAIVLLGIAVVATLAALRATVIGTAVERDHARAHQWLQAAVGAVQEADYVPCNDVGTFATAQQHMVHDYKTAIDATTTAPPGWGDSQLAVLSPIEVWDGNKYWTPTEAGVPDPCYKAAGFSLELITIQVQDPLGEIIEKVQVVKGD